MESCGKILAKEEMDGEGWLRGWGEQMETPILERKERSCVTFDKNEGRDERKDIKSEDMEESQSAWVGGGRERVE